MQDFAQFKHHLAMIRKRLKRIAQDDGRVSVAVLFKQKISKRQTRRHAAGIVKNGVRKFRFAQMWSGEFVYGWGYCVRCHGDLDQIKGALAAWRRVRLAAGGAPTNQHHTELSRRLRSQTNSTLPANHCTKVGREHGRRIDHATSDRRQGLVGR